MAEGLTVNLVSVAIWVGLLSFWLSSRILSLHTAYIVTFVKVLIPLIYFAFFFNGTWHFLDDFVYQSIGTKMLEMGYNPLTVLFNSETRDQLYLLSEGPHLVYGWWNFLSQYLFGKHYYSPVFLNVALTFLSGNLLFCIARQCGFSRGYGKGLLLFFLLHWEVLAWSSLINMKDIFVMTMTLVAFYLIFKLLNEFKLVTLMALLALIYTFFWIRFFVPLMLLVSALVWILLYNKGLRKYALIVVAVIGGFMVILSKAGLKVISWEYIIYNFGDLSFSLDSLFGILRTMITPQPWSIAPNYTFLILPSICHWLLFFPAAFGGWMLWNKSKELTFIIIYLLVTFWLYGAYDEDVQGPRQRFQVVPIIAWMQFHFLWVVLKGNLARYRLNGSNKNLAHQ